jgi:ribonuclease III
MAKRLGLRLRPLLNTSAPTRPPKSKVSPSLSAGKPSRVTLFGLGRGRSRSTGERSTLAGRNPVETRLGVRFKNRSLLDEALVHSSYVNERPDVTPVSNERLEFLGDAVLGLIVADELFAEFPSFDEGKLTELRTHLVRRDTLAEAGRRLDLGEALLLGKGEETGGGRERPTNLACAYEAVVGAIFLDRGLEATRRFIQQSLGPEFAIIGKQPFPSDPKSALQEMTQAQYQAAPAYRLVKTEGPDHARRFTVEVVVAGRSLGTGRGSSKQQAEKDAAQKALDSLSAETSQI